MSDSSNSYFSIPIVNLEQFTKPITFTIYICLSDNKYVAVFKPQSGIDETRLKRYAVQVEEVFIKNSEKSFFDKYLEKLNEEENIQNQENQQKENRKKLIEALGNATRSVLEEIIMPKNITDEDVEQCQTIIKTYVTLVSKDPQLLYRVLAKFNESGYMYYHSVFTSILSIYICRLTKQYSQRLQELVGLGGFLHDIGKIQIFEDQEVEGYQKHNIADTVYELHPEFGMRMLQDSKLITEEVLQIIYQHHERPDGSGYPNKTPGPQIFYPAALISVADAFANFTGRKPYGLEMSPRDAVRRMLDDKGAYNKHIIKTLTELYRV